KLAVESGATVELTEVLLVSSEAGTTVGTPVVPNAKVICQSLGEGKAKKIVIYRYKRRKGFAKKQGHRQPFTRLSIQEIRVGYPPGGKVTGDGA
ncbi:MAG: 50S ribosomal protein L21, partial [Deltaproteobacteria bacterium]